MNSDALIIKLLEDYPANEDKVREIKMILSELENRNNIKGNVERLQQICNDLYLVSSTENLIELQVIINEYRYEYDITDPREVVNVDSGNKFVQ